MTMIEQVAKALCKAADDNWDWSVFYIVDARDTAETGRAVYRAMARAAIAALSEPTMEMQWAGLNALRKAGVGAPLYGWASADCHRAMLAEAGKEAAE